MIAEANDGFDWAQSESNDVASNIHDWAQS